MPARTASRKTKNSLEAENRRLKARLRELESEDRTERSAEPRRARKREETEELVRDIPSHAADTMDRLGRGLVYAFVEQIRSTADVLNTIADEIFGSRSRRTSRSTAEERRSFRPPELLSDVTAGIAEGVHESLNVPLRAVDRFWEVVHEDEADRQSGTRSRSRETRSGRATRVRKESTRRVKTTPTESETTSETVESAT